MSAWNGDLCETFCWCCVAWMWALLLLSRLTRLSGPQLSHLVCEPGGRAKPPPPQNITQEVHELFPQTKEVSGLRNARPGSRLHYLANRNL